MPYNPTYRTGTEQVQVIDYTSIIQPNSLFSFHYLQGSKSTYLSMVSPLLHVDKHIKLAS